MVLRTWADRASPREPPRRAQYRALYLRISLPVTGCIRRRSGSGRRRRGCRHVAVRPHPNPGTGVELVLTLGQILDIDVRSECIQEFGDLVRSVRGAKNGHQLAASRRAKPDRVAYADHVSLGRGRWNGVVAIPRSVSTSRADRFASGSAIPAIRTAHFYPDTCHIERASSPDSAGLVYRRTNGAQQAANHIQLSPVARLRHFLRTPRMTSGPKRTGADSRQHGRVPSADPAPIIQVDCSVEEPVRLVGGCDEGASSGLLAGRSTAAEVGARPTRNNSRLRGQRKALQTFPSIIRHPWSFANVRRRPRSHPDQGF